jgi:membrane protease YdiL (CAAX protease family)
MEALMVAAGSTALHCRGFVLQTMVNFAPHLVPVHVFTTSLQFTTAHHANALSMLTIVISGLCLGTSYLQSGMNLLVPIIAHSLINLGVMVYMAMQP